MGQEVLDAFWKSNDRIYNENTLLYHRLARACGLPDCAFWLLYTLRSEEAPLTQTQLSEQLSLPKQTVNSALKKLVEEGYLGATPIRHFVTGVSAGIVDEQAMLDLQYSEDSRAQVDLNCVMNELGEIIELQGTGEGRAFTLTEQQELVRLCAKGNRELLKIQKEALGGAL